MKVQRLTSVWISPALDQYLKQQALLNQTNRQRLMQQYLQWGVELDLAFKHLPRETLFKQVRQKTTQPARYRQRLTRLFKTNPGI